MIVVRHAKTGCLVGWLHKLPSPDRHTIAILRALPLDPRDADMSFRHVAVEPVRLEIIWRLDDNGTARPEILVSKSAELHGCRDFELY